MKRRRNIKRHYSNKNVWLFFVTSAVVLVVIYIIVILLKYVLPASQSLSDQASVEVAKTENVSIVSDLLDPNEYSRPQTPLKEVRGVVIHYTANPGTDAKANRDYFNGLPESNRGRTRPLYVSSHYVIGLDGTIIQCVPLDEVAYASNDRNNDTISIECCHPESNGKFTDETYDSLVRLVAWLCGEYNISSDGIIRHYDVTGKNCPKYFVEHEKKWKRFKKDVFSYIDEHPVSS